ncbi:hypothetical protein ACEPAH_9565 [Sanghuangporus vaninii]
MNTDPPNPPSGGQPVEPADPTDADSSTQISDRDQLIALMESFLLAKGYNPGRFRGYYDLVINNLANLLKLAPRSIAASDLANNQVAWDKWSQDVGLYLSGGDEEQFNAEIESICDNVKYPLALNSLEATINVAQPNMAQFVASIRSWIGNGESIQWDTDPDAPRLWESLLSSWSFTKNAVAKLRNEASQRPLADAMLHLIFYQSLLSDNERCEILLEAIVALPLPKGLDVPVISSAKADAIALKMPPRSTRTDVLKALAAQSISSNWLVEFLMPPLKYLHVGAFALEAKRTKNSTAEHQIGMYLCSMQHQRRVLSLKDKVVYGATCVAGDFQLYASAWRDQKLFFCPVETCIWDLKDPVQFIQCLYFLRALKIHLDESFKDDFDNFDKEKLAESLRKGLNWRNATSSTKRGNGEGGASESGSKRSRTGPGAEDDMDDVPDSVCDDDTYCRESYVSHPMTSREFVKLLPFITDTLLKYAEIGHWKQRVASSDHEQTVVHDSESAVMEKATWAQYDATITQHPPDATYRHVRTRLGLPHKFGIGNEDVQKGSIHESR